MRNIRTHLFRSLVATALMPIALTCALAGCASSADHERIANNYVRVGADTEARGDWNDARIAFANATSNADLAESDVGHRAIIHYEYGRALGATCFFDQAEAQLLRAYELDKQAGQPRFHALLELARLNLDQRKFILAVSYFERTFLVLDDTKTARSAPAVYADVLDEYARALIGAERTSDSAAITKRATELRGKNPGGASIVDRTPYGQYCARR